MNTRKCLVLSVLFAGVLLIGTRGRASQADLGNKPSRQTEFLTTFVQPVGSTHFSFGFHIGGPHHYGYGYGYGYHRYHRGYDYKHKRYGYGRYYGRYPYWYKGPGYRDNRYYRPSPYPPYYRPRPPYYRYPYYR